MSLWARLTRRRQTPRVRLTWGVGRFLALTGFAVAMTSLGIYQVSAQHELIRVGYQLDQELFEHRRQLEIHKRLSLSLSAFKDPAAVRAFAEDELKMRVPGPTDELFIPAPDPPRAAIAPTQAGGAP